MNCVIEVIVVKYVEVVYGGAFVDFWTLILLTAGETGNCSIQANQSTKWRTCWCFFCSDISPGARTWVNLGLAPWELGLQTG
jgi:hypothetical protein